MLNTVSLVARMTNGPKLRILPTDDRVCSLRVAVKRPGRDRGAVFVTVETWNALAKSCADHLTTGRLIAIRGRLEHAEWTDADGLRRERVWVEADEIDFLDRPRPTATPDVDAGRAAA